MGIETLAALSIGTAIAGAGVSTIGGYKAAAGQAKANKFKGEAESAALAYKAQVGRINAALAREQGHAEATAQRMKTNAILGRQKVIQGASGIDVDSESFQDVRGSTAHLGELDALTIMSNAEKKAWSYETQAELDEFGSKNAKLAAEMGYDLGMSGALWGAGANILGGASSVSQKWASFGMAGIF